MKLENGRTHWRIDDVENIAPVVVALIIFEHNVAIVSEAIQEARKPHRISHGVIRVYDMIMQLNRIPHYALVLIRRAWAAVADQSDGVVAEVEYRRGGLEVGVGGKEVLPRTPHPRALPDFEYVEARRPRRHKARGGGSVHQLRGQGVGRELF